MRHPEVFVLPALMLADWFLTVLGAVEREKKYGENFKSPHYEMNPRWQAAVGAKRWFNPRHLLLTALLTGGLVYLIEVGGMPDPLPDVLFGCLFVVFGTVVGRHLSNILIFRRLAKAKRPEEVSGQVTMSHALTLTVSAYQYLSVAIPVTLVAVFSPTPFVLGGLVGAWLMFPVHWIWLRRHRKAEARKAAAAAHSQDPAGEK